MTILLICPARLLRKARAIAGSKQKCFKRYYVLSASNAAWSTQQETRYQKNDLRVLLSKLTRRGMYGAE
jgi:hypothetical protein